MRSTSSPGWSAPQAGFVELLREELVRAGLAAEDVREHLEGGPGVESLLELGWRGRAGVERVGVEIAGHGDVVVFQQPEDWPLSGRTARREHLFARSGYPRPPVRDEQQRELSAEAVRFLVELLRRR